MTVQKNRCKYSSCHSHDVSLDNELYHVSRAKEALVDESIFTL